jgi:hypothetical protein
MAPFLVRAVAAFNPARYPQRSAIGGLPPGAEGAHDALSRGICSLHPGPSPGGMPTQSLDQGTAMHASAVAVDTCNCADVLPE